MKGKEKNRLNAAPKMRNECTLQIRIHMPHAKSGNVFGPMPHFVFLKLAL